MLKEGGTAPAFQLPSDAGETVSLKDFLGRRVVLYFYPKDDTPGCTLEAQAFRDAMAAFRKRDTVVLGVSRDSVESHARFRKKHGLPFTLLSDADGKVCRAYGVWKEKTLHGKESLGIERTTFLIDEQGKIVRIFPKVKVAGHCEEVLASL